MPVALAHPLARQIAVLSSVWESVLSATPQRSQKKQNEQDEHLFKIFFKAYLCAALQLCQSICNSSQRVYFPKRGFLYHLIMSELGKGNLLNQRLKILCIKGQVTSRFWGPNPEKQLQLKQGGSQHLLPEHSLLTWKVQNLDESKTNCTLHPVAATLSAPVRSGVPNLAMGFIPLGVSTQQGHSPPLRLRTNCPVRNPQPSYCLKQN